MDQHSSNINRLVKSINDAAQSISKISCDSIQGQVLSIDEFSVEIEGLNRFVKRGEGVLHRSTHHNLQVVSVNKDAVSARAASHRCFRIGDLVALEPPPLFRVHDSWIGSRVYDTGLPVEEEAVLQGKPYAEPATSSTEGCSTSTLTTGLTLIDAVFPMRRGGTYLLQASDALIMRTLNPHLQMALSDEMVVYGSSSPKSVSFTDRSLTIVPRQPERGRLPQSCLEALYICASAFQDQGQDPLVICQGPLDWEQLDWLGANKNNSTTIILGDAEADDIARHEAIDEWYKIALDVQNGEVLRWLQVHEMKLPDIDHLLLEKITVVRRLLGKSAATDADLADLKRILRLDQETDGEQLTAALSSVAF